MLSGRFYIKNYHANYNLYFSPKVEYSSFLDQFWNLQSFRQVLKYSKFLTFKRVYKSLRCKSNNFKIADMTSLLLLHYANFILLILLTKTIFWHD